jgi:hypothetical protein
MKTIKIVIDPPMIHEKFGITKNTHDFVRLELTSESEECLAWIKNVLSMYAVAEFKENA